MGTSVWKGPNILVETKASRVINIGERVTYTQVFEGKLDACFNFALLHARGSVSTLTLPGGTSATFILENAGVTRTDHPGGVVTLNWTMLANLPEDEFSVTPFEVNPALERNGYFSAMTPETAEKARAEFSTPNLNLKAAIKSIRTTLPAGQAALAAKLLEKLHRGNDSFYLAGLQYSWVSHSYVMPSATLGGLRQAPLGPMYGLMPSGMSWLRRCDEISYSNGVYRIIRTWIGGPGGWFDSDLYPSA